jgi:hypothetical protein
MDQQLDRKSPQASDQLHPAIYAALAGLAFWLVLSAWIFFSQKGYLELALGVVSALIFVIVAIPTLIHFVGKHSQADELTGITGPRWRTWISGDFDIERGRRKSVAASVEILLPMAAAVIGITAIGIVFRVTEMFHA